MLTIHRRTVPAEIFRVRHGKQKKGDRGRCSSSCCNSKGFNEEAASNAAGLKQQQTEAETGGTHQETRETPTYCSEERKPATCASENMLCRYFDKLGPVGWFGVIFGIKIGLMHFNGEINLFRWGVCHAINGAGVHGSLKSQYPLSLSQCKDWRWSDDADRARYLGYRHSSERACQPARSDHERH